MTQIAKKSARQGWQEMCIRDRGYLDYGEVQGAQKVLRAAALTYIASFLLSLLQFLRLLAITGSRRD